MNLVHLCSLINEASYTYEMALNRKDVGGKFNINGKIFTIYGGVNPIGRNREAVVNIKSLGVSQQHAIIILVDDDLHFISDLKSSNGTFLDNKKLDPLQLYRLENGSRLKFADIEGTYSKCTSNNGTQESLSILSENTQNFTQNFYGSDTQIMDNTTSISEQGGKSQFKNNISSQELAEMADKLENSYIYAHEQPTQVVNPEIGVTTSSGQKEYVNVTDKNQSVDTSDEVIYNMHEVETQVIFTNEVSRVDCQPSINKDEIQLRDSNDGVLDYHEAETQVIHEETDECSSTQSNRQSEEVTLHDIETQAQIFDNNQEVAKILNSDVSLNQNIEITKHLTILKGKEDSEKLSTLNSGLKSLVHLSPQKTLDNNTVNPGEVLNDNMSNSQNSLTGIDMSLDESEDDIRPIKKSLNIFKSQDSTVEDLRENTQKCELISDTIDKFESTNDSDSDIIRPLKKSINIFESQDSEGIGEGSNDSVDFMTMQKIPTTQKILDCEDDTLKIEPYSEKIQIGEMNHNTIKNYANDGSETDVDGSETENEMVKSKNEFTTGKDLNGDVGSSPRKMIYSTLDKSQTTNSETNSEGEHSNSIKKIPIGRKKKSLRKKKSNSNVTSDSDSETDKEFEKTHKLQKIEASMTSDSDNEIEKNESLIKKNKGDNPKRNESVGLILEDSAYEEDPNNSGLQDSNEKITIKESINSRSSIGHNEILNDSDFIPSTQEDNSKSISQNSKFENSENSFKLGLTQLMEEGNASQSNELGTNQGNSLNSEAESKEPSQNQLEVTAQKKFTFKKSPSDITKQADITLDYDEDIYQARTQNICAESGSKMNNSVDKHIFLQPTQEAPKKLKQSKDESITDEEIYMLSTQKLDGSSSKNTIDDIYQQSTQKLIIDKIDDEGKEDNGLTLSDKELYQLQTQKIPSTGEVKDDKIDNKYNENPHDEEDIFATQVMNTKDSPSKCLESELEHMFATQRALPSEDSLDSIQDIVHKKEIINEKLPLEDKDLEAILATQKILTSPKNIPKQKVEVVNTLEKSVESQLEVIFASQTSSLPPDKFVRPPNPLVDIFGQDTQDTQDLLKKNVSPREDNSSTKNAEFESSSIKLKKSSHIGSEQSFALLEADSFKIRRSGRIKNCEDITVSCSKSRVSMIVVPHDKKSSDEETKTIINVRNNRKRKPPVEKSLSNMKESRKKRRISETSDTSENENEKKVHSKSNIQNIKTKNEEIKNKQEISSVNFTEKPQNSCRNRSSRIQKKMTEENIESTNKEEISDLNNRKSQRTRSKTNQLSDTDDDLIEIKILKNKGRRKKDVGKSSDDCGENFETENINRTNNIDKEGKKASRTRTSKLSYSDNGKHMVEEKESPKNVEQARKNSKKGNDCSYNPPQTPSRMSKRGSTIKVTTPPKIKRIQEETPSSSRRDLDKQGTPNRTKRKLKPKVVFTMMESPQLESQIKLLGGSVVDSVESCTVLITKFVKRTMKLLSAVGMGKPICSELWVQESKKENNFLDPWDYVLVDEEAETRWNFSLKTSLERSSRTKLFEGYTFQLLVSSAQDVLKGAIESCGGKIVMRTPKVCKNFVVVASLDQKDRYKKILNQQSDVIIVEPEAIFDGVLRQEIRFERHLLK